ncbi:MAG TPA: hypothetical protein ENL20_11665 [Candidatus Cloacimonetes bacterium]|nr:hypothetical protein [Candidatus Cloacimonadota bacterium]
MGTTGMLEAIGALIIGGIFMVMMFNAYHNVNVAASNITQQISINAITESVCSMLDSLYLSKVGAGVDSSTVAITKAWIRDFKFLGKINPTDPTPSEFYIDQGSYDSDQGGYPLRVKIDGTTVAGPFYMPTQIVFRYFDVQENEKNWAELLFSSQRDLVRSVRIDFELFADPVEFEGQKAEIKQRIIFWKYFKNLYLRES